jgi:thiamine transport system substrate-binding protein
MKPIPFVLWLLAILSLSACQPVSTTSTQPTATLTLASHDSFSISEDVILQFESEHNVQLRVLTLGDAGEALNKIILSKDAPLADLFFGVDNAFLSRALNADVFVPYASPLLAEIPDDLELDPQSRLLPVDYGYVNINADKEWFAEAGIPLPQTLEDLIEPQYENLFVVQNPATSSPGLAFLLTTVAHFGEEEYLDFWRALRDNGVLVTSGWSEAYFDHFTAGSGGTGNRPLVVSYSTSPPADVVYATDGRTEPATVNVSPDNGTFRQIEFVGMLKGAEHPELAQALIDYMLGRTFQEDIPLQMFVYPANVNASLPEVFQEFGQTPTNPVELAPEYIEQSRELWINAWTDVMLR